MRVKLKTKKEILKSGFDMREVDNKNYPDHIELIDRKKGVAISLDLKRCKNLEVVTQNSITEERYKMFKEAFEVIEK